MPRFGAALPLQNLSPAHQVAYIRQAETSGYRAGHTIADIDIACFIRVCVTDDPPAVRQWMRRERTGYAIVEAYHAYFTTCGFGADSTACREAWQQGDRAGAMQCISDAMVTVQAILTTVEGVH